MSHNVSEGPTLQELHHDPQLVSHQVAVVHVHHVLMMVVPHNHHLKHRETDLNWCYMIIIIKIVSLFIYITSKSCDLIK